MAKSKHKSLLPKRIAGVKVPKSVRKGRFGEFLASRTGQALLAEAIMAAGAVGVAKQTKESAKGGPLAAGVVADALRKWQTGDRRLGKDGGMLAYALGEAARSFVNALGQRTDGDGAEPANDGGAEDHHDHHHHKHHRRRHHHDHAEMENEAQRPAAHWASETDEDRGLKKKPISYEAGPL